MADSARGEASGAIVVEGGADNSKSHEGGCRAAAAAARGVLAGDGDALAAALATVCVLEDAGGRNAGSGPVPGRAGAAHRETQRRLQGAEPTLPGVADHVFASRWNDLLSSEEATRRHGGLIGVTPTSHAAASKRATPTCLPPA
ncbi:hypothetical protein [Piscinibacter koreensis]|uniref:Uncharacterized protein n=1 Tax=Piscinibacter koreensis TaxID=2742824 RepID=A0A7Y6NMH7_9BURK|nr:hypothetical protein [Schlegelella koreensis]NUZ05874.1 hypothetical protein [Schlegelella koreensis]